MVADGLSSVNCAVLLLSSRQDHVVAPTSGDLAERSISGPIERVWLEHRPAAEVADELSMSIEAVYMAKSRILRRLQEEVEDIAEHFSWLDAMETS